MPVNPCGRVVDFARKEYRTKCRFFKDSDLEVDIHWYRAAPDAPMLGMPTAFMDADWLDELYDQPQLAEVGEVVPADRPYAFKGPPFGLDYEHVCGTADEFANGVEFDPDRHVLYDEQGLPLCCNAPVVPQMGVVVGLEVEVSDLPSPGLTCLTATELTPDVAVEFAVTAGVTYWWYLPAVASALVYLDVDLLTGTLGFSGNLEGSTCAFPVPLGTLVGFGHHTFANFISPYRIIWTPSGTGQGVVRVKMGPVP